MKCNLPGNYKPKGRQGEAVFHDAPVEYKMGVAPQIDRVHLPKGYSHRPMMGHGTGNTHNFTRSARDRRENRRNAHNEIMRTARTSEGVRWIQGHQSSEQSEM